jgi:hypothetical protein
LRASNRSARRTRTGEGVQFVGWNPQGVEHAGAWVGAPLLKQQRHTECAMDDIDAIRTADPAEFTQQWHTECAMDAH